MTIATALRRVVDVADALTAVALEVVRADRQHGTNLALPDVDESLNSPAFIYVGRSSEEAREHTDNPARLRRLTWADILVEEVAEALDAVNDTDRRLELLQVAAVAVRQAIAIRRRPQ